MFLSLARQKGVRQFGPLEAGPDVVGWWFDAVLNCHRACFAKAYEDSCGGRPVSSNVRFAEVSFSGWIILLSAALHTHHEESSSLSSLLPSPLSDWHVSKLSAVPAYLSGNAIIKKKSIYIYISLVQVWPPSALKSISPYLLNVHMKSHLFRMPKFPQRLFHNFSEENHLNVLNSNQLDSINEWVSRFFPAKCHWYCLFVTQKQKYTAEAGLLSQSLQHNAQACRLCSYQTSAGILFLKTSRNVIYERLDHLLWKKNAVFPLCILHL